MFYDSLEWVPFYHNIYDTIFDLKWFESILILSHVDPMNFFQWL